jgi:multisubunit Na+/H+ antiporter MnhB subunit
MNPPASPPKVFNPFFTALLVVGTVFALTACAYGVMTVRGLDPHQQDDTGLMGVMNRWGLTILVAELAVLAVLTVLAIGTDDFWARRAAEGGKEK